MQKDSSPTIQGFKVRAVRVPMTEPHQTASGVITESPLVLTDILTDAGVSGHSIVFTYTPAAHRVHTIGPRAAFLSPPRQIRRRDRKETTPMNALYGIAAAVISLSIVAVATPGFAAAFGG